MNEEAAKAQIVALSDQLLDMVKDQSMDIYVSALIHTLRVVADVVPRDSSYEIGRVLLQVGGLLVSGNNLTSSNLAPPVSHVPASSSIH